MAFRLPSLATLCPHLSCYYIRSRSRRRCGESKSPGKRNDYQRLPLANRPSFPNSHICAFLEQMPYSGGSYIYLRESYGKDKWGRFMAFLFIFQFLISAPIEIASGFIAMSQYMAYVTNITNWVTNAVIGCCFCLGSMLVLYQDLSVVGKLTIALWVGTVGAIIFALVAGGINFNPENLQTPADFPPQSGSSWGAFIFSLGTAARIGIYDFAGYYDACQMGDEVKNPRRNIPRACVWTCIFLAPVFIAVVLAIAGVVPWDGEDGFVNKVLAGDRSANYVMSTFCEILFGRAFAIFFTFVVVYTIFGSCFALLLGYAYIPYSAARDGYFYKWFGHEHPTKKGLADYSLLFLGAVSAVLCFVDLSVLIEGMLTTRLLIQFIAQAAGAIILRKKAPNALRVYKIPLYPLPIIVNFLGFGFVFCTTQNWIFMGDLPLLEIGILTMIAGGALYFPFAKMNGFWPYAKAEDGPEKGEVSVPEFSTYSNPLADAIASGQSINELPDGVSQLELHVGEIGAEPSMSSVGELSMSVKSTTALVKKTEQ
mmetsp:Transcript_35208/g.99680  ORF Transcript_35208/g.99680 Transcript_35208/m.99680 type:complete len:539 (+) Transcript_35208:791-2407(+)